MTGDRLPASVEATSFVRKVQADGDFAAILHKGDPDRGAILIVVRSRGELVSCLERTPHLTLGHRWEKVVPGPESDAKLAEFLARRARFDPDSWVIELDIAHPERFIAETTSSG